MYPWPSPGFDAAFVSGTEAIEVRKRATAGLVKVKPSDVRNNLSDFGVFKRRSTPHTIPREEQFQRYVRVDLVPQQMTCQRSDARIALTLRHSVADQLTPIRMRPLGAGTTRRNQDPAR